MTAVELLEIEIKKQISQCKTQWECGYQKALNEVFFLLKQTKEMEKERTLKLCYGVWRAVKTGANYIYISKDSSILGFVEPLSEENRLKIDVELFIAIKSE
jgi:uncharacterized protein (DUF1499 family)